VKSSLASSVGHYEKRSNGVGSEELLLAAKNSDRGLLPASWSPDGKFLLFSHLTIPQPSGLWVLPLAGEREPHLVANAPSSAEGGKFSPDGKWIAFTSRESGTDEVYVIPLDSSLKSSDASENGSKWQISSRGGRCPRWRGDGKGIYWLSPMGQIMAAQIERKDSGI
jgi:Tol biopolymer transport system component